MKKRIIAYIALVLIGVGASILLPKTHATWTIVPGPSGELILFLNGESANIHSPRLEIRCNVGKSEVRLYIPIGVRPAFGGPSQGPATMGLTEAYEDSARKPIPSDDTMYGNVWSADDSQTFAIKLEPMLFIQRIMGQEWLTLRGTAFGAVPAGFAIDFPVSGLGAYRDKIAASCGTG